MEITAKDGKKYNTEVYSLDALLPLNIELILKKPPNLEYGHQKF